MEGLGVVMVLVDRVRQLSRWLYLQFGAAYFRIVAVGGSAAIVFVSIWPLSTVVVVMLVAALTPVVSRVRKTRSDRKAAVVESVPPSS